MQDENLNKNVDKKPLIERVKSKSTEIMKKIKEKSKMKLEKFKSKSKEKMIHIKSKIFKTIKKEEKNFKIKLGEKEQGILDIYFGKEKKNDFQKIENKKKENKKLEKIENVKIKNLKKKEKEKKILDIFFGNKGNNNLDTLEKPKLTNKFVEYVKVDNIFKDEDEILERDEYYFEQKLNEDMHTKKYNKDFSKSKKLKKNSKTY